MKSLFCNSPGLSIDRFGWFRSGWIASGGRASCCYVAYSRPSSQLPVRAGKSFRSRTARR